MRFVISPCRFIPISNQILDAISSIVVEFGQNIQRIFNKLTYLTPPLKSVFQGLNHLDAYFPSRFTQSVAYECNQSCVFAIE